MFCAGIVNKFAGIVNGQKIAQVFDEKGDF